jgi:hypothetical protein
MMHYISEITLMIDGVQAILPCKLVNDVKDLPAISIPLMSKHLIQLRNNNPKFKEIKKHPKQRNS